MSRGLFFDPAACRQGGEGSFWRRVTVVVPGRMKRWLRGLWEPLWLLFHYPSSVRQALRFQLCTEMFQEEKWRAGTQDKASSIPDILVPIQVAENKHQGKLWRGKRHKRLIWATYGTMEGITSGTWKMVKKEYDRWMSRYTVCHILQVTEPSLNSPLFPKNKVSNFSRACCHHRMRPQFSAYLTVSCALIASLLQGISKEIP